MTRALLLIAVVALGCDGGHPEPAPPDGWWQPTPEQVAAADALREPFEEPPPEDFESGRCWWTGPDGREIGHRPAEHVDGGWACRRYVDDGLAGERVEETEPIIEAGEDVTATADVSTVNLLDSTITTTSLSTSTLAACEGTVGGYVVAFPPDEAGDCVVEFDGRVDRWRAP